MSAQEDRDRLEVIAADAGRKPLFAHLLQFYLYDMARYFDTALEADGRYEAADEILEDAWDHPYLFTLAGEIAGFALLTRDCTIRDRGPCWYVAEFCVLAPYRRRGVGCAAMAALYDRHPGDWEITWFDGNAPAAGFWPRAIPSQGAETYRIRKFDLDWTSVAFTV